MATITSFLTEDHRHADGLFNAASEAVSRGALQEGERQLAFFRTALESHMRIEEDVLFPAFEQATGMTSGPTAVMRQEHQQMLGALDNMSEACVNGDAKRFESIATSFLHVLNMHSMKEEQVLYPMCDRVLQDVTADDLRERLEALRTAR
jgi:iron-sulfur cluster repair protein YtfE (RIC family)